LNFLADMGVSMSTVEALRNRGENVLHLREVGLKTLPDDQIVSKAANEHRVILTFDLDFGSLLAASGSHMPSVILFRLRNQTPQSVTPRLLEVIAGCTDVLNAGALIVVEDLGYRVRHLPIHRE
jgi:predicted nuclease of predicted toxin-antitoxin system